MEAKQKIIRCVQLLFLSFFFFFLSCAVNPVTGKKELMLVSTDQELAIGKNTDQQVIKQYGIYPDEKLQAYLTKIGRKIAPYTHRPNLPYSFKVVDSDVINAFAVPGGYVYFTRGIFAYLNDEAELAGVLGHEMGHVNARHSAKQMSRAQLTQVGLGVGSILSETFRKYAGIANAGVQLMFLKFSRDDERQADELGVEYATKSGYDAKHMAEFFHTLDRMRPKDGSALPGWLSTHPDPKNRFTDVKKETETWQKKMPVKKFAINRNEYLRKIDGLVFGPDPRQGFVENQIFYHPTLKFQFPVPSNWLVNNLPAQVQMFPKSQEAAIIFSLTGQHNLNNAVSGFIQEAGANVIQKRNATVHRYPGRELETIIVSNQDTLHLLSYFIQKENRVYVFHGLTARDKFAGYRNLFKNTMTRFNNVTDRRILSRKPDRIKIFTAGKNGSVKTILLSAGVKSGDLEKTALLNGLELSDQVTKGTLLKMVIKGS